MSDTYIVRLYFRNALHIGASNPGIGIEGTDGMIIHSDTLWAALCNNWAIAGKVGNISFEDFLESFRNGNPLFQISSAFPLTNSGSGFWLPRPVSVPYDFSESNNNHVIRKRNKLKYSKEIKKIRFISLEDFKRWMLFDKTIVENIVKGKKITEISDDIRPHNTLNRLSCESQIYHSGTTYFEYGDKSDKTGMYFLLRTTPDVKNDIENLLNIIKDTSGIGGNRGIGSGTIDKIFDIKEAHKINNNWDFLNNSIQIEQSKINTEKQAYCLLSLYHPNTIEPTSSGGKDNISKAISYELILRKGWTGSLSVGRQVKRKTIRMFGEGSIFLDKPIGQLANLTPEEKETPQWKGYHKIYRYGYAFSAPIKICMRDYNNEKD